MFTTASAKKNQGEDANGANRCTIRWLSFFGWFVSGMAFGRLSFTWIYGWRMDAVRVLMIAAICSAFVVVIHPFLKRYTGQR